MLTFLINNIKCWCFKHEKRSSWKCNLLVFAVLQDHLVNWYHLNLHFITDLDLYTFYHCFVINLLIFLAIMLAAIHYCIFGKRCLQIFKWDVSDWLSTEACSWESAGHGFARVHEIYVTWICRCCCLCAIYPLEI